LRERRAEQWGQSGRSCSNQESSSIHCRAPMTSVTDSLPPPHRSCLQPLRRQPIAAEDAGERATSRTTSRVAADLVIEYCAA
jgi:hypothetical protein